MSDSLEQAAAPDPVRRTRLIQAIRPFIDIASGEACALVIGMAGPAEVAHPRCYEPADLAIELDAFYCTKCQYNGRISGAWCLDEIRAWRSL